MNPVEPPAYEGTERFVWKGPRPDIEDLVVRFDRASQTSISVWALTLDERRAILDGARVVLQVSGRHPPLSLSIEGVAQ